MTRKRKNTKLLCSVVALLLLVIGLIGGRGIIPAFAEITGNSSALEDLQTDGQFNLKDYPAKMGDYSLQVIQVAESTNGILYLYTYQPCEKTKHLVATEINMSLSESVEGTRLYGLTPINTSGVFGKYAVNDLTVSNEETRYYNITSIYRAWDSSIDNPTGNDNEKNAVTFKVGKCFKATTENGKISYSCKIQITIEIINPYADFLRYNNGFILHTSACDSHYVAFSTDMQIDELYEADLEYKTRSVHSYHKFLQGPVTDYGNYENKTACLTDEQEYSEKATGWLWGQDRNYKRIQSVEEFQKSEDLTDETQNNLKGKQWVLRFTETNYEYQPDGHNGDIKYTEVSNVTILRLKFKSAGKVYNLGAVSDKVTGDNVPGNNPPKFDFWQWLADKLGVPVWVAKLIVYGFAVLIVLGILMPILSLIFPVVGTILKAILKGIWLVLSAPFRFIAWVFNKIKGEN